MFSLDCHHLPRLNIDFAVQTWHFPDCSINWLCYAKHFRKFVTSYDIFNIYISRKKVNSISIFHNKNGQLYHNREMLWHFISANLISFHQIYLTSTNNGILKVVEITSQSIMSILNPFYFCTWIFPINQLFIWSWKDHQNSKIQYFR